jgi:hypothetical protein
MQVLQAVHGLGRAAHLLKAGLLLKGHLLFPIGLARHHASLSQRLLPE